MVRWNLSDVFIGPKIFPGPSLRSGPFYAFLCRHEYNSQTHPMKFTFGFVFNFYFSFSERAIEYFSNPIQKNFNQFLWKPLPQRGREPPLRGGLTNILTDKSSDVFILVSTFTFLFRGWAIEYFSNLPPRILYPICENQNENHFWFWFQKWFCEICRMFYRSQNFSGPVPAVRALFMFFYVGMNIILKPTPKISVSDIHIFLKIVIEIVHEFLQHPLRGEEIVPPLEERGTDEWFSYPFLKSNCPNR